MNYATFDIRIGHAAQMAIPPAVRSFYSQLSQRWSESKHRLRWIGPRHTIPIDFIRLDYEAGYVGQQIAAALAEVNKQRRSTVEVVIYDLSQNPYGLIRDPQLINIARSIEQLCIGGIGIWHLVLLPQLPGQVAAGRDCFLDVKLRHPELQQARIVLLANSGAYSEIGEGGVAVDSSDDAYVGLRTEAKMSRTAEERLKSKLVLRLGHYRGNRFGRRRCRHYSYVTERSDGEFSELLEAWWVGARPAEPCAIVHDTKSNPSLSVATRAFADSHAAVGAFRMEDVVAGRISGQSLKPGTTCVLIEDVVETGRTVSASAEILRSRGLVVHREVAAGICRAATREIRVHDLHITGCVRVDPERDDEQCHQCALGLDVVSDADDEPLQIRSYDMWWMAEQVGWEPEPRKEVPANIGYGYESLPVYTRMLNRYGDWVAYKMRKRIDHMLRPDNFFVVHPDESGANAVSRQLALAYEQTLAVVRVPRRDIRKAQASGGRWSGVVRARAGATWVRQLTALKDIEQDPPGALITDVFNASGSTYAALHKLLGYFGVKAFCYFPFVDRDPGAQRRSYDVPKVSLYEWYGPRRLRSKRKRVRSAPR